jgi:hypothetical protein
MPKKSVTASLEALLQTAVDERINAVKQAAEDSITAIRQAAGRVIAELEAHAERLAAGDTAVVPQAPTTPATPAVPAQAPAAAAPSSIARATWIPYGAPLPDYAAHGPGAR